MRNIIAITFDSLRADHCGYVGYERNTTPNMDQMAADGIGFKNAIAPASRTNPSMSGIFTGEPFVIRNKVSNREHSTTHLKRHGTLAEDLSELGYNTGAFCPNAYSSRYYGFDRGFDRFEDFLFQSGLYQRIFESHLSDSAAVTWIRNIRNYVRRQEAFKSWDTYIDEMARWATSQKEPFFLWAFSLDTHFPYITPRKYRKWSSLIDMYYYNWRCNQLIDEFDIDLSETERQKMIDIYDDSIRFGDVLIQELRDQLAAYDPIFVIFGDHGEGFGERDMYGHFYPSLYEENVRVPLVIWDPIGSAERTVNEPFSLLEIKSLIKTIAAGGADESLEIKSSQPVVSTDYDGRWGRELTAVRVGNQKCIRTQTESECTYEQYDLSVDPGESQDISGDSTEITKTMQALAERRVQNEREKLAIKSAAASIGSNKSGVKRYNYE